MASLLIDFDNIIKFNKLPYLERRIKPIPVTKFSIGLVLVITRQQYEALQAIPKGYGRVQYLNSEQFVDSISGHAYLIYNKKKRICEIMDMERDVLSFVLENVLSSIPNNVTLWIGVSLDSPRLDILLKRYISANFHDPYICKVSPLGFEFSGYGLCMIRQNDIIDNNAVNDVKYVLSQFLAKENGDCNLYARLSDKSIQYLRQLSKMGSTINPNGVITQKEVAGILLAGKVDADLTYHLEVDRDSIVSGKEEGVEIIKGLYNFHSHPQEAYERHNVKLGWPSCQDYIGFMGSLIMYGTILHIVVSLEGFYVISLSNYWFNNKKKLGVKIFKFILQNYDLYYENGNTSNWYVNTVNGIAYDGYPLFLVQFFSWHDASTSFVVPYCKNGINCFARQSTKDKYKYLYS